MRVSHFASFEDYAFLGVGAVAIAVGAVALGYGVASFVEAPEIQAAMHAMLHPTLASLQEQANHLAGH